MTRSDVLKKELDSLPAEMLDEVARYVRRLKRRKPRNVASGCLLSELSDSAIDDDLPADLAEQHDHYLYGVPKH
jgi:hypothetical protein